MINNYYKQAKEICERTNKDMKKIVNYWAKKHSVGIFVFNISVVLLLLLRSAGYFHPFLVLTVNKVVMTTLILSVIFLGARNKFMFFAATVFWLSAAFFKLVHIEIWAERMGIYTYEALFLGILLLIAENIIPKGNGKTKNS